jgi:hypothetical protein
MEGITLLLTYTGACSKIVVDRSFVNRCSRVLFTTSDRRLARSGDDISEAKTTPRFTKDSSPTRNSRCVAVEHGQTSLRVRAHMSLCFASPC